MCSTAMDLSIAVFFCLHSPPPRHSTFMPSLVSLVNNLNELGDRTGRIPRRGAPSLLGDCGRSRGKDPSWQDPTPFLLFIKLATILHKIPFPGRVLRYEKRHPPHLQREDYRHVRLR